MTVTHFLLPNTDEDTDKLKAFAISYSKALDAGLPKATTDKITQAFLDNLKTLVKEKPRTDPLIAQGGWSYPSVARGGIRYPSHQAYDFNWPFPYEEPKRYEIYHTGTNRPAAFFQGKVYYSRTAADQDIQDTYNQTLKSVSLTEWLGTYEARIKH